MDNNIFIENGVVLKIPKYLDYSISEMIWNRGIYDNGNRKLIGFYSSDMGFMPIPDILYSFERVPYDIINQEYIDSEIQKGNILCAFTKGKSDFYADRYHINDGFIIEKCVCKDVYIGKLLEGLSNENVYTAYGVVSLNTKSNSSIINKQEVMLFDKDNATIEDVEEYHMCIRNNTLFLTDSYVDNDGWIPTNENGDVFIIDIRNGKFEAWKSSSDSETVRGENSKTGVKWDTKTLMHPFYYEDADPIRKDNEIDDTVVSVCGEVFDTESCSFVRDKFDGHYYQQSNGIYYEEYNDDYEDE